MSNKIAFLGDTHFGARGDNQILRDSIIDYFDNQFFPYLIENNIKIVIQLGDLFDKRKSTNHETLYLTRKHFLERFDELGIQLLVLIGNHDIYYRESNQISCVQEFLRGYNNITPIIGNEQFKQGETTFDLIPWINDENYDDTMDFIDKSSSDYCIGHFEFAGFKFSKDGIVAEKGLSRKLFSKYKHVYSGHYHTRSSQGNITYTGTPYELTWADYDDPKGFMVFNLDTGDVEFIENTFTLHNRLVYDDSDNDYKDLKLESFSHLKNCIVEVHVNAKKTKKYFDKFMKFIYDVNPATVEVVDNTQKIKYDVSNNDSTVSHMDTQQRLDSGIEIVHQSNVMINKDKLSRLGKEIYDEAECMGRL